MASIIVKSPIHRHSSHGHRSRTADRAAKTSSATPTTGTLERRAEEDVEEAELETALSLNLGNCNLSTTDHQIISLIQQIPRKMSLNSCSENFHLYEPALNLCKLITSDKSPEEDVHLPDKTIRRKVYQLVFDALYHYDVLQELLVESSFFSRHFHAHGDETLLHLMLFDLQNSKFSLRFKPNEMEGVPEHVIKMAEALWDHRTKLNATLARMRVEGRALKIHQLIPDRAARKKYESDSHYPCYARVNPIKVQDVQTQLVDRLLQDGFIQVYSQDKLKNHKKCMCLLQEDLLVFSADCRGVLDEHELVENGCIVLQDLASFKFVDRIRKTIETLSGDVVVTEPNSGVEIAHIATALGYRGKVFVYNTLSTDTDFIKENLRSLEIKNVKFFEVPFVCMSPDDDVLEDVQMIVCLPTAPPSTVGNQVDYALQEGDFSRLKVLLQPPGKLVRESEEDKTIFSDTLATALSFDHVEHIFLKPHTESDNKRGRETIISDMLEQYNTKAEKNGTKNFILSINSTSDENNESRENAIIMIQREPDKPPTPPRRVIDRAIANGIIDGEGISDETICVIKKKRKRSRPSIGGIPMMTFAAQQKVVKKKEPSNNKIFRI